MKAETSMASMSTRASSADSVTSSSSMSIQPKNTRGPTKEAIVANKARSAQGRRSSTLILAIAFALALAWSRYTGRVARRSTTWGSTRLAMLGFAGLSFVGRLLGISNYNEIQERPELVPQRQHLMCWHPHGLACMAPLFILSGEPRKPQSALHGTFIVVADALLKIPVLGPLLMTENARAADRRVMDSLFEQGKSVAVCPGGIHEQINTDPSRERVFFPPNLGFVRQAIKHGVPLIPLYCFGENQVFDVPGWMRQVSQKFYKSSGAGIPLGTGRWGLPFLPKPTHISCHVGEIVEVGQADENPTDERVEEVFRAYCISLYRVFNQHKDGALPADVASHGLQLIWRGHEAEDLSEEGVAKAVLLDAEVDDTPVSDMCGTRSRL